MILSKSHLGLHLAADGLYWPCYSRETHGCAPITSTLDPVLMFGPFRLQKK